MDPIIRLRGLRKYYGDLPVLRGIDLDVRAAETVSVIGPSGSGKSTLLRLLMTLERPDGGTIEIDGESLWTMERNGKRIPADSRHLRRVRRKVGMVFQHFNLFPHMTARGNVMEGPIRVLGMPHAEAAGHARRFLERVGLADKVDAYPAQLSGGQKQRVAIARALAMQPKIMLFDEITSALDPELVSGILRLLRELSEQGTMTMIIVTHHMRFAERCSDRVVFFDNGIILEDEPPEVIFRNPRHERTRKFLESILEAEG
ncbi:MAG: ectoine/hydroxyectoine ABC transporter ATP-binding protein EhuA [Betaproteobacteria bacterium RIFCSPLOWO2_12_FULL_62_13]|nr:MAG: ectoine/hydroxyectoine ABC transporter ATP-binding protein EhuA [Betaproteobacteria bacterium RIFCSPLOWO2_12_FULL_62_13]